MKKKRIQLCADEETKRWVEAAATRKPRQDDSLIDELRALCVEILADGAVRPLRDRGGERLDVDQELEQVREERACELSGLR